jgi:hypothetical protein
MAVARTAVGTRRHALSDRPASRETQAGLTSIATIRALAIPLGVLRDFQTVININ